jgi:GTP cyclohydrolase I
MSAREDRAQKVVKWKPHRFINDSKRAGGRERLLAGKIDKSHSTAERSLATWIASLCDGRTGADQWFTEDRAIARIDRTFRQLLNGYEIDPLKILKATRVIPRGSYDGEVVVSSIPFHSICPHHLLPFSGLISIKYRPGEMILGLGKLPRLVYAITRRFTIQEDIARDICRVMIDKGRASRVEVTVSAQHACMSNRGPGAEGTMTTVIFEEHANEPGQE